MNQLIAETDLFSVEAPSRPFVSREEGGSLRIISKLKVKDRTELTTKQAMEYTLLSMAVGRALELAMTKRGVEIGNINWQEMGNWSVHKSEGITMHMYIFGRAKTATIQKYGEAVQLPFRETGFYDGFSPLDAGDIMAIKDSLRELIAEEKYNSLQARIV